MRTFGILVALATMLINPSWANPVDQLDAVAVELEAIVAELEANQAQAAELKARLVGLQALSEEHQTTLRSQETLLAEYRNTVKALEAHDRATTELAQMWKARWEAEKALSGWVVPLAGVAVAVAIVEALVLVVGR